MSGFIKHKTINSAGMQRSYTTCPKLVRMFLHSLDLLSSNRMQEWELERKQVYGRQLLLFCLSVCLWWVKTGGFCVLGRSWFKGKWWYKGKKAHQWSKFLEDLKRIYIFQNACGEKRHHSLGARCSAHICSSIVILIYLLWICHKTSIFIKYVDVFIFTSTSILYHLIIICKFVIQKYRVFSISVLKATSSFIFNPNVHPSYDTT